MSSAFLSHSEARGFAESAMRTGQTGSVVIADVGGWIALAWRGDDASLRSLEEARDLARAYARGEPASPDPSRAVVQPLSKAGRMVAALAMSFHPLDSAPTEPLPLGLAEARSYCKRAIQEAEGFGSPIGVAVVDELGRLVSSERMDGSALGSCEMAQAKAVTSAKFRRPTADLTEEFRSRSARLEAIEKLLGFTILAMGGGAPIVQEGQLIGALGVSGSGAQGAHIGGRTVTDVDIVRAVLGE